MESFLLSCGFCVLMNSLWKWSKALLVIVSLESMAALMLALLLHLSLGNMFLLLVFFAFFVCEALVLLSSLLSSLRVSGSSNSSLLFI